MRAQRAEPRKERSGPDAGKQSEITLLDGARLVGCIRIQEEPMHDV